MNPFTRLDEALRAIHLTTDPVRDVPQGRYVLDLLVGRAVTDPGVLLSDEADLLATLDHLPAVRAALLSDDPDRTSYAALGVHLESQERALKLVAALVTLHRGKLLSVLDLPGMMRDPNLTIPYDVAVAEAFKGYLSIVGVNLLPEDVAARKAAERMAESAQ